MGTFSNVGSTDLRTIKGDNIMQRAELYAVFDQPESSTTTMDEFDRVRRISLAIAPIFREIRWRII